MLVIYTLCFALLGSYLAQANHDTEGGTLTIPTISLESGEQVCPSNELLGIVREGIDRDVQETLEDTDLAILDPCNDRNYGRVEYCPATSCEDIFVSSQAYPAAGHYWLDSDSDGNVSRVYCNMQVGVCIVSGITLGLEERCPARTCSEALQSNPDLSSGLYWVLDSEGIEAVQVDCIREEVEGRGSCNDILQSNPGASSGTYEIITPSGTVVEVYCDMTRECCNNTGGWTRVAFLNRTDPNESCPAGWRAIDSPRRSCGRDDSIETVSFTSHGLEYSHICGRIRGYQVGETSAFNLGSPRTIDEVYVEGVSVTYGTSPREHVWTFAATRGDLYASGDICACGWPGAITFNLPSFVGDDLFCEAGTDLDDNSGRFYADDPLWDGLDCRSSSTCCEFNTPPYFCKTLPEPTNEDLEVRLMADDPYTIADAPIELIEIYIQ